jgi:hypothetical protein
MSAPTASFPDRVGAPGADRDAENADVEKGKKKK